MDPQLDPGHGEPGKRRSAAGVATLSFLVPGLGHLRLGDRRTGLLLLFPQLVLLAVAAAFLAINGVGQEQLLALTLQPDLLLGVLIVSLFLLVERVVAVVDSWRIALEPDPDLEPHRMRRFGSVAALSLLLVLTLGSHGVFAFTDYEAYDTAASIFSASGPTGFDEEELPSIDPAASGALETLDPTPSPTPTPKWWQRERLDILLIGSDAGPDRWSLRTDTMVLASVEVATGATTLFGFPRNLENVPLPSPAAKHYANGRYPGLLNSLYVEAMAHPERFPGGTLRGYRAIEGAISTLTGVDIEGMVLINLNGFVKLVNALGGITIRVPYAVYDASYPKPDGTGNISIYIKAGLQKMNGTVALEYARSRHQDSDYGRMARQQLVLKAIRSSIKPVCLASRIPQLLAAVKGMLWTDLTPAMVADLLPLAQKTDAKAIRSVLFVPPTYPEILTNAAITKIRAAAADPFGHGAAGASPTPGSSPDASSSTGIESASPAASPSAEPSVPEDPVPAC